MSERIYLNDGWSYSPTFKIEMTRDDYTGAFETVRLPHTVVETPFNDFTPELYQKESLYRKSFKTLPEWQGKKILLTVEAAAHLGEVFLNGKSLFVHRCGYTAFTVDLTEHLSQAGEQNLLAVRVDSRENVHQPPFGNVIDYMTYGGLYREVYLDVKNPIYIEDIFVSTKENTVNSEIKLNVESGFEGFTIHQIVLPDLNAPVVGDKNNPCAELDSGVTANKTLTSAQASGIAKWDLETPALYTLKTELKDANGTVVDEQTVRFGFREIQFDAKGFFLNGKKIKLRGLNRHQSWPYVGYAMPKNMQREDADILKYELGLNEVRTSHYPQSQHFVDRCDEIGLLVFTEFPGWQFIGDAEWKEIAVQNVREMVLQYRNHPSVFMWGVRINESPDDDEFYKKTNAVAHELDSTRPTAGVRNFKNSHFFEDVYTYNDFSYYGPNEGTRPKDEITKSNGGYMVTEYNGHMYPTKSFDDEWHRMKHALRHATVLDSVASRDETGGSSGWCAFDYNTHKEFGAGDYICYHGVMDMFRNPKLAASVYRSQQDASVVGDVLEISSSMDLGEYPAGVRESVWIFTNADSVKFYVNDNYIKEFVPSDSPYKHLAHGPILVDDFIGSRLANDYNIPEKKAEEIKKVLHAVLSYGMDNMPAATKAIAAKLAVTKTTTMEQMGEFFSRYLGNLGAGGSVSTKYTFEAYRNGKLVKTVIKTPAKSVQVLAEALRTSLKEESSYDVASVRLRAVDENQNVHPYCQEAVFVQTEGAIELIGPSVVSLKGGSAAVYVKTIGKKGNGSLLIRDWLNRELKLEFTVE